MRIRVNSTGQLIGVAVVAYALYLAFVGWLIMITVGVVNQDWLHHMPTIGFNTGALLAFLLTPLVGILAKN